MSDLIERLEEANAWLSETPKGALMPNGAPYEAAARIRVLEDALRDLMRELPWVNEQLDLMPDDFAEAQLRAAKALGDAS